VIVADGTNAVFSMVPAATYIVSDVRVDGDLLINSVGRVNSYTFPAIGADHSLFAHFDGGWSAPGGSTNVNGWNNPGNANTSNNSYATSNIAFTPPSVDFNAFGITIPTGSTIDGIEVALEGNSGPQMTVSLSPDGVNFPSTPKTATFSGTDATIVLGNPGDKWGATWNATAMTNFTVKIGVPALSINSVSLDQIQVKIHFTRPTALTTVAASGTYGGTTIAPLSATLLSNGVGVANQPISFTLDGNSVGTVNTNAAGVATLPDASLVGINMGNYPTGVVATYAGATGYASASATAALDVTARALTVTATGNNKVYDGTTNATVTLSDDRVAGDTLLVNYASAAFDTKDIGTGKPVDVAGITVTGADAANYTFNTTATTTADITPRVLTVNATGVDKVYDGTTDATVNLSHNGVVGDTLTLAYASASFDTKNVGTNKPVDVAGITVTGADAGNYTFNTTDTTIADITARVLTVTATGVDKVYDGTTSAAANLFDDRVAGDVLTVTYSIALFDNPNVGIDKPVAVVGIALAGTDAGNYSFNSTASTTADITGRTLTVSATGVNKVYDGNTNASATLSDDRIPGDVLNVNYGSAAFDTKDVGTGKTVTVSGITVTGSSAGNYIFNTTAITTADITPRVLVVSAAGIDKVYNGNTDATVNLSHNGVAGDVLTLAYASASFDTKDVGTGKTVTVLGITVTGTDAGNYTFNTTDTTTADITARALVVSAAGINKVYDGNTDATVTLSDDHVAGDVLTLAYASASFDTKDVGTGKTVTVVGITVGGTDAGNYTPNSTTTTTADITARGLTVTATGINKQYDGNANATVTLSDDRVAGDVLTLGYASALFNNPNIGVGKPVNVFGISITGGADAGNYTLTNVTAATTADITVRTLIVSATGINKVYDGNTDATVTLSDNRLPGDVLILAYTSASFDTKDVGTGKPVAVSGITVTGADAGNYAYNTTAATTADITERALTVSAAGIDKVYDGNTDATVTLSDDGVAGDVLTLAYGSASFDTKDVGTGKTVTVIGITVGGADAGNYLFNDTTTTTAAITARDLTVTATGINKIYDGNTTATVTLSDDRVAGDVLTLGYTSANFNDPNIGVNKPVNVAGISITGGADAGNYTLTNTTAATTASITSQILTVTATGVNKVYDGTTNATVTLSDDRVPGDVIILSYTSATFDTKHVGTGKTVSVSGITVTGADAGNYAYNITATTTADITARPITVTAGTDTKDYDATTSSSVIPTISAGTLALGDTASFIQNFDTPAVGIGKTLSPSGSVLDGNSGNNYNVTLVDDTTGVINGIPLTILGTTANSRVYDGTTVATLNTGPSTLSGVVGGDVITLNKAGAVGAFANKNVGPLKTVTVTGFTITGTNAGNYILQQPTGLTANVTVRPITVTAQTNTKVYDSTMSSAAVPAITAGTLAVGDTDNFTQAYTNANVGTGKTLVPSGDVTDGNGGGNYAVTFANITTGVITARPLTITADAKAKAFGTLDPPLTYTFTGTLVGGDTLSGALTRDPGEAVGVYAIRLGSLSAGTNYTITYVGANLTISIINQTITVVTHAPATAAYNTNFNVAATASSGLPVAITTTGVCTGSGTTTATIFMNLSGTGNCVVHFNQGGDVNFSPALEVIETTTAQKANQTITISAPATGTTAVYNSGFNAAATATSGLPVTYGSAGVCTNVLSNFTMTSGTGTCTVQYDQAGDANYNAAPQVTRTVTAQKADQLITVTTAAPGAAAFNANFTVAATASSTLPVAYSAAGVCNNAGPIFTMTASTGNCSVRFDQAGDANYNAAPQITQTVNAQKAGQTITVTTPAPANAAYNSNFTVAATASSGLPVTYNSIGSCTNVGATFTITSSTGTCSVLYDQAGDANYNAAPQITETVNAQKANQTITVTTPAPANAGYNSSFTVAATADSGLPVAYTASGVCSRIGATFTMTASTGTCSVQYNQAGNANYNPATQVTETVTAQKGDQTIDVTIPAPPVAAFNTIFTVEANATSGLPVAYSSAGSCSNVGPTFTMTASTGTCTVQYDQAGDADYNPAPQVTEIVNTGKADQTITVTIHAPATVAATTSFTVAATASSGLPVDFSASGACTNVGTLFTAAVNSGTCTVHYNQTGDASFNAAPEITETSAVFVDSDAPTVTVEQASIQIDPTNVSPINFTVVFNETVTGFTDTDVTIAGTAAAATATVTEIAPNDGTRYTVAISGMANDGTVIVSVPSGAAQDASGNGNFASTSTDNTVTYFDAKGPTVGVIDTNPDTGGDSILKESEKVIVDITHFKVKFSQDVYDPTGDSDVNDVTNPYNYMLIRDLGDTAGFQTISCSAKAITPADTQIAIGTVLYDKATTTATFTVNGGLPISDGTYRLFICGSTSIVDPLDTSLKLVGTNGPGTDYLRNFTVEIYNQPGPIDPPDDGGGKDDHTLSTLLIPVTGFAPNQITRLPIQPADAAYQALDEIRIEVPTLGINYPIVGVSLTRNKWNLTWLKDRVGYLEGSAYPTFRGNTVLTAHVIDANNNLGPFSDIKGMQLNDKILLHAYGNTYVYQVQDNRRISPANLSAVFKHQEYNWVTLVTCEEYDATTGLYKYRRMVRAVLISVVQTK
jgi:LPXTG-site transpeptidase (sortase) family protein